MKDGLYLQNVERLEPDLAIDWGETGCEQSSQATALISIAMSLKRIADTLERPMPKAVALYTSHNGTIILRQINSTDSRNVYRNVDFANVGTIELIFADIDK